MAPVPRLIPFLGKGEGGGGDYEQDAHRPMYQACGFVCMYCLAASTSDRFQVQILHEWDRYNKKVSFLAFEFSQLTYIKLLFSCSWAPHGHKTVQCVHPTKNIGDYADRSHYWKLSSGMIFSVILTETSFSR